MADTKRGKSTLQGLSGLIRFTSSIVTLTAQSTFLQGTPDLSTCSFDILDRLGVWLKAIDDCKRKTVLSAEILRGLDSMANMAWDDLRAEDVGTTPEKLLDALRQMRKVMDAEVFCGDPLAPFTRGLLDRKITQVETNMVAR